MKKIATIILFCLLGSVIINVNVNLFAGEALCTHRLNKPNPIPKENFAYRVEND